MDKAKDFEKGFEEYKAKKKQEIEELGQDIYDNCPDLCENGCGGKPCYKCIAEALHRDNYRKIPENAVVLTEEELIERDYERYNLGYETHRQESQKREDYIETLSYHINDLENALLIVRKETAEKFAKRVHNLFNRDIKDSVVYTQEEKNILKEFVESIDEIAKEIMDKGVQNGN